MENSTIIIYVLLGITASCSILAVIFAIIGYLNSKKAAAALPVIREIADVRAELIETRADLLDESRGSRSELGQNISRTVNTLGQSLVAGQSQQTRETILRQDSLQKSVSDLMRNIDGRLQGFTTQNEQQLAGIRTTVETRLSALQEDNGKRLEEMRMTVDEKLQKTLETRLGQSFRLVSERLEQVYKGLGEMQNLASGVGDLKKVLSNVKTRGVLGELQLNAILEQILAPNQYKANVITRRGSRNPVEYAIILPGDGDEAVMLPIDAKFPADAYIQLTDAYELGDPAAISAASSLLSSRVKAFARDIRDKYIDPPYTTDFAVMFLPFEGLYAQVLQLGLLEILQREYRVSIAGPTTMAALLTSLQMGFRTLAIQKRSGEVWEVLGAVRTEFDRFGEVLGTAQTRLEQANNELDKLIGVRTRMIQRKLAQVGAIADDRAAAILAPEGAGEAGDAGDA